MTYGVPNDNKDMTGSHSNLCPSRAGLGSPTTTYQWQTPFHAQHNSQILLPNSNSAFP